MIKDRMTSYRVITHASEILTGSGIRKKNGKRVFEEDLDRIRDGAIVYTTKRVHQKNPERLEIPHQIEWVGQTANLPSKWTPLLGTSAEINLQNKNAVIPGLIDCHNHLIFAGDRSDEFAARCAGASYEEIAKKGGGIQSTVRSTRLATPAELEELAVQRLKEISAFGVRTVEIKSGYGLSTEDELKILRVIPNLRRRFPEMTLTATFLGAHAFPSGQTQESYLNEILNQMLPAVAAENLADTCDVFIDQGYFNLDQGRRILQKAQKLGLKTKIHADELGNTESASLAVELNALSADHLLKISDAGIQKLAHSETIAVLLPGTAFYLQANYAPARRLLDQGAAVALATDFNPGTCMTLSLPTIMTLSALYLKMTRAEIFAAVTYNAARALGLHPSKGTLEPGKDADFAILPFSRFEEMYYRFAWTPAPSPIGILPSSPAQFDHREDKSP